MTTLTDAASGDDLYPEFRARLAERPDDRPLSRLLSERLGLCPTSSGDSHVGEFIGYAAEIVGTKGYDFDQVAETRRGAIANIEGWASGRKPVDKLLATPSREERVHMGVTHIMGDVLTGGSGRRPSFNLPNDGYIENISRDAVVEVPGIVERGRVCGVPVGALPGPIASMVQNEVEIQKLVVDAAVTGDRGLALAALTIDPVVNSARKAEALLDDILTSHAAYLPQFA
jgi:alpha-galactosidase